MRQALAVLRNRKTGTKEFRAASRVIARGLARDVRGDVGQGKKFAPQNVVLVPVLRAGLALLPEFLEIFPEARVGFVGLKRNEKTLKPKAYYHNLPVIKKSDMVVVLDPMLATGGSAVATLRDIVDAGAQEKNIIFASVVAAPEGIAHLQKNFPHTSIVVGVCDEGLDKKGYIVPGLGDFGDRYFGTN